MQHWRSSRLEGEGAGAPGGGAVVLCCGHLQEVQAGPEEGLEQWVHDMAMSARWLSSSEAVRHLRSSVRGVRRPQQ